MKNIRFRYIGAGVVAAVWLVLALCAWLSPPKASSESERRPLEQFPELSGETLLSGSFMTDFEDYTLDQFPLRDTFRQIKALFSQYVLNQSDNNDIYIADGYAAEMAYPLDGDSLAHALKQFQLVYDKYLVDTGSAVYTTVVPDKGYYLAEQSGHLAMDYEAMFETVRDAMPWASYVDITDCLQAKDYYRTDTHWRQEKILSVAQRLSQAMDLTQPQVEDYTVTALERPFYGVYYGQAALPMEPETMYILENELLADCTVYSFEKDTYTPVYNMDMLTSKDLYDVYLSGAQSLLRIENPNAKTDRELIIFRDSFGSSLAPLLVQDYKTVTLVDIRYINAQLLGRFLEFSGQDVLFMYSTLVLNKNLI